MARVELEIPARADYLALARLVVAAAAGAEPRLRDDRIDDLQIAVSEATTNAIEAHAELSEDERIVIVCDTVNDGVQVEVHDKGGGFDPEAIAAAPHHTDDDRLERESGLGIPLIRVLADEADIRNRDGGTTVRLVVYHGARARGIGSRANID